MYGSLYQTGTNKGANGSGGGAATNSNVYKYVSPGGETTISASDFSASLTLPGKDLYLIRGNIPQTYDGGVDYTVSGNNITLNYPTLAGEVIILTVFY